jgi:zinc transport system ATP-binding protein
MQKHCNKEKDMKNEIEIRNVSVYYDNFCAIKSVNLNVEEKDFLAIIGPNGGGKSTLLKAILGLVPINQGEIERKNQKPIGYVPQYSNFDRKFPITAEEVILSGVLNKRIKILRKYSKDEINKAKELIKRFSLNESSSKKVGDLSGGQIQKVLIARALMGEPSVLILDEPTASLDVNAKDDIYNLLAELNKKITIIIVSHDLLAISPFIKNIACLNKTLHYHGSEEGVEKNVLEKTYGCPVELIGHGEIPHRVLKHHKEGKND